MRGLVYQERNPPEINTFRLRRRTAHIKREQPRESSHPDHGVERQDGVTMCWGKMPRLRPRCRITHFRRDQPQFPHQEKTAHVRGAAPSGEDNSLRGTSPSKEDNPFQGDSQERATQELSHPRPRCQTTHFGRNQPVRRRQPTSGRAISSEGVAPSETPYQQETNRHIRRRQLTPKSGL